MPNTPCVVGEGMTAICRGPRATPVHVEQARRIFECVGRAVETEEKHFNAITALSGSGPAYHYLIMEAMADAGVRVGLPRDLALTLVAQTTLGAARMVQTSGRHPAALRDDVTTPAGCTIGGLLMLEDGKIRSVLARAIEEATRIASKLGPAGPPSRPGTPTEDMTEMRQRPLFTIVCVAATLASGVFLSGQVGPGPAAAGAGHARQGRRGQAGGRRPRRRPGRDAGRRRADALGPRRPDRRSGGARGRRPTAPSTSPARSATTCRSTSAATRTG